jgi:hypothetical protein
MRGTYTPIYVELGACVIDGMLSVASKVNKKLLKGRKDKSKGKPFMTRKSIEDITGKTEWLTYEDAEKVASYYDFGLRCFFPSGKLCAKRETSTSRPVFTFILLDDHCYSVLNPYKMKDLQEFRHDYHLKPSSNGTVTRGEPMKASAIVSHSADLANIDAKEESCVFWTAKNLLSTVEELWFKKGIQVQIAKEDSHGNITGFTLYVNDVPLHVKSLEFNTFSKVDYSKLTLESMNKILDHQHRLRKCIRSEMLSEYKDDTMFAITTVPKEIRFEEDTEVESIDFVSSYSSIYKSFDKFPVFRDGFEAYDGHAREPHTLYVLQLCLPVPERSEFATRLIPRTAQRRSSGFPQARERAKVARCCARWSSPAWCWPTWD